MNFYFCEGCGKRLTELDLEAGEGRNKKLKGVYCKSCAVGVMTLETLPLTAESAEKLLQHRGTPTDRTPAAPASPALRKPALGPSAPRTAPGHRPEGAGARVAQLGNPSGKQGKSLPSAALFIGIGCLVLLIPLVLLLGRGSSTPSAAAPESALGPGPGIQVAAPGPKAGGVTSAPILTPRTQSNPAPGYESAGVGAPIPQAVQTETAYARFEKELGELKEDDLPGRIRQAEAFLSAEPVGAAAVKVRGLLADWRGRQEASAPGAPGPAGGAAAPPLTSGTGSQPEAGAGAPPVATEFQDSTKALAGAAPADRPEEEFFLGQLNGILAALATRDYEKAARLAGVLAAAPELMDWRAAGQALPEVVGLIPKRQMARQAALKELVGKKIELATSSGPRKGVVLAVSDQDLSLEQQFMINGRPQGGATSKVPWASVTAESLERLAPISTPTTVAEWGAEVLRALAERNLAAAQEPLKHCAGHALEAPLARCLARRKAEGLDRTAKEAWGKLVGRGAAQLSPAQLDQLLRDLEAFEGTYRETAFARAGAAERGLYRESLEKRTLHSAKLLAECFRGRVTEYDAQTGQATLQYDFQQPEQALDFSYLAGTLPKAGGGVLKMEAPGGSAAFCTNRFELDRFSLAYTIKTSNADGHRLRLGLPPRWGLRVRRGLLEVRRLRSADPADYWRDAELLHQANIAQSGEEMQVQLRKENGQLEVILNGTSCYSSGSDSSPLSGRRICWESNGASALQVRALSIKGAPDKHWLQGQLLLHSLLAGKARMMNLWQRKGRGPGSWSDPGNWSLGRAPRKGDQVYFRGSVEGSGDCEAGPGEVAAGLAALVLDSEYAGRLTLAPEFGENRTQVLHVEGPLLVLGGEVECSGLVRGTDDATGTGVTVKATQFRLGSSASMLADVKGFPSAGGPPIGRQWGWLHGDPRAPLALGSGGGAQRLAIESSPGGGAIQIDVGEGALVVDGLLSANGTPQPYPNHGHSGGGGGSIFLAGKSLQGSGRIEANGGSGQGALPAGCGGRIAVAADSSEFQGRFECRGGNHQFLPNYKLMGAAGSLCLASGSDLTVTAEVGLPPGQHRFRNLVIKPDGRLVCHPDWEKGLGVWIQAQVVTVETGGALTAEGEGYLPKKGPETYPGTAAGTALSDLSAAPTALGRGAVEYPGGGAIRIDAGAVRLDGMLSASGLGPNNAPQLAGAGGSIWLTCDSISGQGSIEAKGVAVPAPQGSPAKSARAGGRIAVYFRKSEFKGECSAAVFGKQDQGEVLVQTRR